GRSGWRRQAVLASDFRAALQGGFFFSHPQCQPAFSWRASYQGLLAFTIRTTDNITGTSTSTPTTVASAAPECTPNTATAVATASSKKLLAPIRADGPATQWATPNLRLSQYARPALK